MAVVATTTYLYVNTSLTQYFVQGSELVDKGPWSSSTFYAINDVVQIGVDQYVALAPNSNAYPTGIVDENWSTLVVVEEASGSVISAGSDAYARALAGEAYFWGTTAFHIGTDAYNLAVTGTNLVAAEAGSRVADVNNIYIAIGSLSGSLTGDLAAETAARIAADLVLTWAGTDEQGTRSYSDQVLTNAIITEQGTRSWQDQVLANAIVDEAGSRTAADQAIVAFVFGSIAVDLAAETGSRIAADLALTWGGTNEATSRAAADQQIITIVETGTNTANAAWALAQIGTVPPYLDELQDVSVPAPTANQVLAFDGSQWIAMDSPSQVAPGAFTLFLEDTASGTAGYYTLLPYPSGTPEDVDTAIVGGTIPFAAVEGYLGSTFINRTLINAGLWEFNTFASISSGTDPANVVVEIYTRDIGGAETFLFAGTSTGVTSTTAQLVAAIVTAGSYTTALTDKLLAKYYFISSSPVPITATIYHGGSEHDSHIHTPIGLAHNDLAGLQGGATDQFYHVTLDQNEALDGNLGYPSASNPFVTVEGLNYASGTLSAYAGSQIAIEQGTRAQADQELLNTLIDTGSLAALAYTLAVSDPTYPDVGNRLISGGNAVWVSGYTFLVEPTVIQFSGTPASFPQTSVTLAASDPSDDRIDIIIADNALGSIYAITGSASTPPALPDYDPYSQFQLTFIPVDALTTEPVDVSRTWIYRENTEWTTTVSAATINPNSTSSPYQGTKCVEGTNVLNNQFVRFRNASTFILDGYDTLYMYINPKAGWGSTRYLRLHWENASGTRQGNYYIINNGAMGFNIANPTYQLVAIPLRLFGVPAGRAIQGLRIYVISPSGALPGFRIDDIALQIGVSQLPATVPDATTTTKGIVLLAPNLGTVANTVVQADDYRMTHGVVTEVALPGTLKLYAADINYGLPNTEILIVDDRVIHAVTYSRFSWEDFEYYGTTAGTASGTTPISEPMNRGTSWDSYGSIYTTYLALGFVGTEAMNNYSTGTLGATALNAGTGWSTNGTQWGDNYMYRFAIDGFEQYAAGTLSTSGTEINSGTNWIGTAQIYAR